MARFSVVGAVQGSKWLGIFEADTADKAIQLALESSEAWVGLCHRCSAECENAEIQSAEATEIE